jgi:uncharacterized protein (DUF2267 family)
MFYDIGYLFLTKRRLIFIMDEIVKMVSEKTGLSEEMSKQAVEMVLDYLKDKLPAPIAGQIDNFLDGDGGGLADMAQKGLGGLFG